MATGKTDALAEIAKASYALETSALDVEHAMLSSDPAACRRRPEKECHEYFRTPFAHDADRIIHSHAFARYMDKTQVFFQIKNDHISRRSLHVQMVSRIARSIGRCLRLNEDLIEAIAIGHDIGHTPCGHTGEAELARLLKKHGAGTFMHNAQSVRVLQTLEKCGKGLNLTLPVLDGILGHNGEIEAPEYRYDRANLTWEKLEGNLANCMKIPGFDRRVFPSTLEGCVVRVSDIISYLGKDFEDAIALGIVRRSDMPESIAKVLGRSNREIVATLCDDIVENSYGKGFLAFSDEVFMAYRDMKEFNCSRIYGCELLKEQRGKFSKMMAALFDVYLEALKSGDERSGVCRDYLKAFPSEYRETTHPARIVADYISLMTDQYFLRQFSLEFVPQQIDYDDRCGPWRR